MLEMLQQFSPSTRIGTTRKKSKSTPFKIFSFVSDVEPRWDWDDKIMSMMNPISDDPNRSIDHP